MIRIAILANLATFSLIVSQPLFYLMALTNAQRGLSAAAYIELRQRINPVMNKRVPLVYAAGLITGVLVLGLAFWSAQGLVLGTTLVALLCLLADVLFMTRESLPLNSVMDGWSPTDYPPDWQSYREEWLIMFGYRQVILLIGFASLLVGAVLHD